MIATHHPYPAPPRGRPDMRYVRLIAAFIASTSCANPMGLDNIVVK